MTRKLHALVREQVATYGSQSAAAEQLGVSQGTISRIVRKPGYQPQADTLQVLADSLGVSVALLLERPGPKLLKDEPLEQSEATFRFLVDDPEAVMQQLDRYFQDLPADVRDKVVLRVMSTLVEETFTKLNPVPESWWEVFRWRLTGGSR